MEEETRKVFDWCLKHQFYEDALVCLHRLRQLRPDQKESFEVDLIRVLKLLFDSLTLDGSQENIMSSFEKVIALFPGCPHVYFELGCFLYKSDALLTAISMFQKALQIKSDHTAAKVCLENANSQAVDQWHFRMLNDSYRNKCFQTAITDELSRTPSHSVLDIGSGTGILSIFAHQAGAKQIYACESSEVMFNVCEQIVAANNLRNSITLFNKYSHDMIVPLGIPERVSLLVTEVFDAGLFGEGLLDTLKHAWKNLLLPPTEQECVEDSILGGKVIPNSATIYITLVECEWLRKSNRLLERNFGPLDFSDVTVCLEQNEPYNSEYLKYLPGGYKTICEPTVLCTVNFNDCSEIEALIDGRTIRKGLVCSDSGILDCVVVWFELNLNHRVSLSTGPESDSCWEQAIFPVTEHLEVDVQSVVDLNMRIEGHLKLEEITIRGHEISKKKELLLSSEWIRKLNNWELAHCLESSLRYAFDENKCMVVDMGSVPLVALLALKMEAERIMVIGENKCETFLKVCQLLLLPTDSIIFSDIAETSKTVQNEYNVLFFDPIELTGSFYENVFEDLATVRKNVLTADGLIFPKNINLHCLCMDSPGFRKYKKVLSNELLDELKICDILNKFQTEFHQDIHLVPELGNALTDSLKLGELNFHNLPSTDIITLKVDILKSGTFNLFVFWTVMQYNKDIYLDTRSCDNVYCLAGVSPLSEFDLDVTDNLEISCTMCNSYPVFDFVKI